MSNIIKEFDIYKKVQFDGDLIEKIKIIPVSDKFKIDIKLFSENDFLSIERNNLNTCFYNKNHALVLLKAFEVPIDIIKKVNNSEEVLFEKFSRVDYLHKKKLSLVVDNKEKFSFIPKSKYITYIERKDLEELTKNLLLKFGKQKELIFNYGKLTKEKDCFKIESNFLNNNVIKINFEGHTPFNIKFERFILLNDKGSEIFSSNMEKFPMEKKIGNYINNIVKKMKINKSKLKNT